MNGSSPVMFSIPGYDAGAKETFMQAESDGKSDMVYKIPPPVWMILFLVVGYVGIRYVMED